MNRRIQGLLLLLLGAAVTEIARGPVLLRYVRPQSRGQVLVTAVALGVLGAVLVATGPGRGSVGPPDRPPRTLWLLVQPLLVIGAAPPALGTLAASRPPARPAAPAAAFPPLPGRDPVPISVSELVLRTVWGGARPLAGRRVRVRGFVLRPARGGFVLARLVITCCAADARPYDVLIRGPSPPPAGSWVEVTATYAGADRPGGLVPVLTGAVARPIAQPADPYG